jgi:hypothetical protein
VCCSSPLARRLGNRSPKTTAARRPARGSNDSIAEAHELGRQTVTAIIIVLPQLDGWIVYRRRCYAGRGKITGNKFKGRRCQKGHYMAQMLIHCIQRSAQLLVNHMYRLCKCKNAEVSSLFITPVRVQVCARTGSPRCWPCTKDQRWTTFVLLMTRKKIAALEFLP